jgi:uncharacterized protein YbaA (DUF1428 family)
MNVEEKPYVDGFVAAVPEQNKDAYLEIARLAAIVYREHGALKVVETWGDDIPDGEITSFRRAVNAKEGEVVVFAWIMWPSKEARDKGNEAVMNDPRMDIPHEPLFDSKRMIYGGFQIVLDE